MAAVKWFAPLAAILLIVSDADADKPNLQQWTSTDGKTIDAVFAGYEDESQQTAILLTPQKVPVERLSDDSRKVIDETIDGWAKDIVRAAWVIRPTTAAGDTTIKSFVSLPVEDQSALVGRMILSLRLSPAVDPAMAEALGTADQINVATVQVCDMLHTTVKTASDTELVSEQVALWWVMRTVEAKAAEPPSSVDPSPQNVNLSDNIEIAFMQSGSGDTKRNSQPFLVREPKLFFVGFSETGVSPFASLIINEVDDDETIHGSISDDDIEADGPKVVAKLVYKGGVGKCFADISTQNCEWFFAVVNCGENTSPSQIEEIGKQLLLKANWPATTPIYQ